MIVSENAKAVRDSFSAQAKRFETKDMSFSKQAYLDHIVTCIGPNKTDTVLEAAAGTCLCGRALAPFVREAVCLDLTEAMLEEGKAAAKRQGLCNLRFVQGDAAQMPFADGSFDIVISRLAFHHFSSPKDCFAEMVRVLKPGGRLAVVDMEAAEEGLRLVEDEIETLRDPSPVRNLSRQEFEALFFAHDLTVTEENRTDIPVSLTAWLALTGTDETTAAGITERFAAEMTGGPQTGFRPYQKKDGIYFDQRWLMMIGKKKKA